MKEMKDLGFETRCVHGAYKAGSAEPQNLPIIQSTTYRYYNAQDVAELFDLDSPNPMYARLGSPTVDALEQKKREYEEVLRQDLNRLDDDFKALRMFCQELAHRARNLEMQAKAA